MGSVAEPGQRAQTAVPTPRSVGLIAGPARMVIVVAMTDFPKSTTASPDHFFPIIRDAVIAGVGNVAVTCAAPLTCLIRLSACMTPSARRWRIGLLRPSAAARNDEIALGSIAAAFLVVLISAEGGVGPGEHVTGKRAIPATRQS